MILFVLACIISFIPLIGLFLWLRNLPGDDNDYKKLCNKALFRGFLTIFIVILFSAIGNILLWLTKLQDTNPLLYQALYNFGVLALAEEAAKYMSFKRLLKKTDYPYSWLDVTSLMTIVGIGFGLLESVVYAIGASIPVVLIRGICLPHAGYGFIVGYFYGRGEKNGRSVDKWIGFGLAWLLHGLYDFSLSKEFLALNDYVVFVALLLAILDIVLVIRLIIFARKARNRELYRMPL